MHGSAITRHKDFPSSIFAFWFLVLLEIHTMKKVVWLPVLVPAIYFLILPFPIVRARIRLKDDELTVFPDSCDMDLDQLLPGRPPPISSDNCGIHRLDKNGSTWLLRSDDGVYTSIPCTVSRLIGF